MDIGAKLFPDLLGKKLWEIYPVCQLHFVSFDFYPVTVTAMTAVTEKERFRTSYPIDRNQDIALADIKN